jgi:predicted transposase/invertase (TIGR01784 family)
LGLLKNKKKWLGGHIFVVDHWDFIMKKWVRKNAQQFIAWILKDAVLVEELTTEIKRETIHADILFLVVLYGQQMLLHIEFQSTVDETMAERLLEYNVQISKAHGNLPVYSCVVYLRKSEGAPQPPLIRCLPNGKEVLRFHYQNIELAKMSAESILREGLNGLLPLVLFTQDGKQALDEVVERLEAIQDKELMALTFTLAGLIFQNDADRDTVMRRFEMLEDILEESWTFQYIKRKGLEEGRAEGLEEGRAEGLEEGRAEGLEEGRAEGLEEGREEERQEWLQTQRNGLISAVQKRFPELVASITEQVNRIEDPLVLQDIMFKLASTQNNEEARKLLLKLK